MRCALAIICIPALGAVVGLLAGASVGGNLVTDFRFAGQQGYEGTGVLGALSGFIAGAVFAVRAIARGVHGHRSHVATCAPDRRPAP